jgi:WD40 repeat protein
MSELGNDNLSGFDIELVRRIDAACRRFEADWRQHRQTRVEDYLAELPDEGRAAARVELEALARELEEDKPVPGETAFSVHDEETVPPRFDPTVDIGRPAPPSSGSTPPKHIRYFGDYEIVRELARGGMGVVFEARQVALNRKVALKMILAGQLADQNDVKRFYTEAEAAANLDHPGIVPIFEVGQHEGQHYFSMGFVEGQSLSQRVAEGPLPPRQAADLIRRVGDAIEYAHQHGVIHRDLKPANILLDVQGNPRVTDFGLAKKVQADSGLTGSGQIMGTPSYMPPEQAGGERGEVGPAADVYALGATLYALLIGRPPFQAATAMDTVIQVLSEDAVPPRRLNAAIPLDLETICLKCLEKEPARRYGSATALGAELGRFLAGEPILARPVSAPERLWRWCRRNPVVAGLGGSVAALILFVAAAGALVAVRLAYLRNIAETKAIQALEAQAQAELAHHDEAARRLEAEQAGYDASTKALAADQALVQSYLSQAENLRNLAQPGRRDKALDLLKHAAGLKHDTDSLSAKLGADAAGWGPAMAKFWRDERPRLRSEATRWIGESSLKLVFDTRFPVVMHSRRGGSYAGKPPRACLASSDDGKWLAFYRLGFEGTDPTPARFVEIIEADTGEVRRTLKVGAHNTLTRMSTLAFDATDQDLLLARLEPDFNKGRLVCIVERWSRVSGAFKGTTTLPVSDSGPQDLSAAPTGGRLVFGLDRRALLSIPSLPEKRSIVWNLSTAKPMRELDTDFTPEAFFPGGNRVIGTTGLEISIRDVVTGKVIKHWPMPDGLVTILGNLRNAPRGEIPYAPQPDAQSLWVSPDGSFVAAIGQPPGSAHRSNRVQLPRTIYLFDAETTRVRVRIPIPDMSSRGLSTGPAPVLAFDSKSRQLAVTTGKSLSIFSIPEGTLLISAATPEMGLPASGPVVAAPDLASTIPTGLLFAAGTSRLFAAAHLPELSGSSRSPSSAAGLVGQGVQSWDLTLPKVRIEDFPHDGAVRAVKLDSGTGMMASAGDDRIIRVRDRDGHLRWSVGYPGQGSLFSGFAAEDREQKPCGSGTFDPTGGAFFTFLPDRVEIWDSTTAERRASFSSILAVSPDRRLLVVPWAEGPAPARELRIHDVSRNAAVLSISLEQKPLTERFNAAGFQGMTQELPRASFSPDSHFVIIGERAIPGRPTEKPVIRIADLAAARVVATLPGGGHDWAIGPASKVLVVQAMAGDHSVLRAYDLATGRPISEFTSPTAGFSPAPLNFRESLSSWISTDDRRMAVRLAKGTYPRQELSLCLWTFADNQAIPIPIDGDWEPRALGTEQWMYLNQDATRLLISGSKKTGSRNAQPVVELWDLSECRRLMSTADGPPKLTIGLPKLIYHVGQNAFATCHDLASSPERIGAILRETATGKVIGRYKGVLPEQSEDGDYLKVSEQGSVSLISLKTREVRTFSSVRFQMIFGVPGRRTAVTSPNALVGRSGGLIYDVTLTDVETGRIRAVLRDQEVLPGGFTPDGTRLATVSSHTPYSLNVWDVETGKAVRSVPLRNAIYRLRSALGKFTEWGANVTDVHFSPDGKKLSLDLNDRFRVLDVESGRMVAIDRPGHRATIRAVDCSTDGALVVSAGDDAAVCLWAAADGRFVAMLEEEGEPIEAVSFSPDARHLAARTVSGRMRLWKLDRAQAGGRMTVIATSVWDTTSLGPAVGAQVTSGPVFVAEGRLVAFGGVDGTVSLRDTANGSVTRLLKTESGRTAVTALSLQPGGSRLAASDASGVIHIWDLSTESLPARLVTEQGEIRAVAFGGNALAVAGRYVELWDVGAGELIVRLEADARKVSCIDLTANGRMLAWGEDRKLTCRDVQELRRLMGEIELGW